MVGLAQTPQHNLVLAHPKTELRWPLLIEDIRLDELSRILNRPLYPFILLLSGNWTVLSLIGKLLPASLRRGIAVMRCNGLR